MEVKAEGGGAEGAGAGAEERVVGPEDWRAGGPEGVRVRVGEGERETGGVRVGVSVCRWEMEEVRELGATVVDMTEVVVGKPLRATGCRMG